MGVRVQAPLRVQKQSENESENEEILRSHSHSESLILALFLAQNSFTIFDFQKLEVYKKAKAFHVSCKQVILSKKLDRYVNDQLGRASFSVPLNIAEGSGKFSKADRKNYFTTARASVFECIAVLDILSDEGKISDMEFKEMMQKADELSRILYAMIKNLS